MIPLGIVLPVHAGVQSDIGIYAAAGFESVSLFVWEAYDGDLDDALSKAVDAARRQGLTVSTLSVYGNPLRTDSIGESVRALWTRLIERAASLGVPLVTGFAGRVPGSSVEESLPAWRSFFSPLADGALGTGLRLAFENCRLGDTWKTGKWNIAITPDAWEAMFAALDAPNVGLEWEPCHQLELLADPHAQLETWVSRVFHVHGKDSLVNREALARDGFYARAKWHRSVLPGEGDADWRRLIAILAAAGYQGTIDVENPSAERSGSLVEENSKSLSYMKLSRLFSNSSN
jgi:sugar phosphate isomerase/epimerase